MYIFKQRAWLPIDFSGIEHSLNVLSGMKSAVSRTVNEAGEAKASLEAFSGRAVDRTKEFIGNIDILHRLTEKELGNLFDITSNLLSQLRDVDSRLDTVCMEASYIGLLVVEDNERYIALPRHFDILNPEERDRLLWHLPDYQHHARMLVTEGEGILSDFRYKFMNICLLEADYGFVDEMSRIYHNVGDAVSAGGSILDILHECAGGDSASLESHALGLGLLGQALGGLTSGHDQYQRDILRPELTETQRRSRVLVSTVASPVTSLGIDKAIGLLEAGALPAFALGLIAEATVMPVVENQITKFNDVIIDGTFSAEDLVYMHPAGETLLSKEASLQEKVGVLALGAVCPLVAGHYQLDKNSDEERAASLDRVYSLTRENIEDMEYSAPY